MDDSIAWCHKLYESLKDGGLWAVPRSGLIFRKEDHGLKLHDTVPGVATKAYQDEDYECIKSHFADAGIRVTKD